MIPFPHYIGQYFTLCTSLWKFPKDLGETDVFTTDVCRTLLIVGYLSSLCLKLYVKSRSGIIVRKLMSWNIPYFPAHKTHFFSLKNVICVLCAEGKYYFQTYKYPYIYYTTFYHEIVKFASKSWDLASLLVNSLLSYPGIYPNVYIASYVILGIYAAAVAKYSQV